MAKTRRRQPSLPKVHVREATDLPINSQVAVAEVDDPYELGAKITVVRSIRDDHLAAMYIRSRIDSAQLSAGRKYQKLYGQVESGARGIDYKERVDGGRFSNPFTDERSNAARALEVAYRELGSHGSAVTRMVLGEGLTISMVSERFGMTSEREVLYVGKRFGECLNTLAVLWGFAQKVK
jgi:hypothetical protein